MPACCTVLSYKFDAWWCRALSHVDAWCIVLSHIDAWCTTLSHTDLWCTPMSCRCIALSHCAHSTELYWCMMQIIEANWTVIIDAWCTALSHLLMPDSIEPWMHSTEPYDYWCMMHWWTIYWAIWCLMHSIEPKLLMPYWASIEPYA